MSMESKEMLMKELECREKEMQSVLNNTGLSLRALRSFKVDNFIISVEYAFKDISDDVTTSIEALHAYVETRDLICIWQLEDPYGHIFLPLTPPETTRLITDYLIVKIQNKGPLNLMTNFSQKKNLKR